MIVINVLVQGIISRISVYAPQCDSDDTQKDDFYHSLINVVRKLEEKEIVIIAGYYNRLVVSNVKKTTWTNMGVMVTELGTREEKRFLSFVQI